MSAMATTAASIARPSPRATATLMYEPRPGRRKSLSPRTNASLIMRKNQPPAMLIMLFQTSPMALKGSSTQRKRCHQSKRFSVATSVRSRGTDRSEW